MPRARTRQRLLRPSIARLCMRGLSRCDPANMRPEPFGRGCVRTRRLPRAANRGCRWIPTPTLTPRIQPSKSRARPRSSVACGLVCECVGWESRSRGSALSCAVRRGVGRAGLSLKKGIAPRRRTASALPPHRRTAPNFFVVSPAFRSFSCSLCESRSIRRSANRSPGFGINGMLDSRENLRTKLDSSESKVG